MLPWMCLNCFSKFNMHTHHLETCFRVKILIQQDQNETQIWIFNQLSGCRCCRPGDHTLTAGFTGLILRIQANNGLNLYHIPTVFNNPMKNSNIGEYIFPCFDLSCYFFIRLKGSGVRVKGTMQIGVLLTFYSAGYLSDVARFQNTFFLHQNLPVIKTGISQIIYLSMQPKEFTSSSLLSKVGLPKGV